MNMQLATCLDPDPMSRPRQPLAKADNHPIFSKLDGKDKKMVERLTSPRRTSNARQACCPKRGEEAEDVAKVALFCRRVYDSALETIGSRHTAQPRLSGGDVVIGCCKRQPQKMSLCMSGGVHRRVLVCRFPRRDEDLEGKLEGSPHQSGAGLRGGALGAANMMSWADRVS